MENCVQQSLGSRECAICLWFSSAILWNAAHNSGWEEFCLWEDAVGLAFVLLSLHLSGAHLEIIPREGEGIFLPCCSVIISPFMVGVTGWANEQKEILFN